VARNCYARWRIPGEDLRIHFVQVTSSGYVSSITDLNGVYQFDLDTCPGGEEFKKHLLELQIGDATTIAGRFPFPLWDDSQPKGGSDA
jgi:hypothetical protein